MSGGCIRDGKCRCTAHNERISCRFWDGRGPFASMGLEAPVVGVPKSTVVDTWEEAADLTDPECPGPASKVLDDPFGGEEDILKILADINKARASQYGTPEDNFARIARHWTVYLKNRFDLDVEITPPDVALLMDLMKTARLENMIDHKDSWVDKAGYVRAGWAIVANLARLGGKKA